MADSERPDPRASVDRWWFEFVSVDGPSGWVDLRWYPNRRRAVYASVIVVPDGRLIVTVDDEIPMAEPSRSLEFRHAGLWAQHVCETPWEHWTVGLEAYGTAVDDAADALAVPCWGDPTPIGLDVEWEASAAPIDLAQPCRVSGEVLVGADAFWIDGTGWRGRGAPTESVRLGGTSAAVGTRIETVTSAPAAGASPDPWRIDRRLVAVEGQLGWTLG